ncbi:MAG: hypothetical protein KA098_05555 [Phenylobacterium sp.]|nr:hypothetical protein [Phenylobacterium sp.]
MSRVSWQPAWAEKGDNLSNKPMVTIDAEANHSLVLPVEPNDFSEFIAKLLGKPQTIERKFESPFTIRKEDINHVFELVRQRIDSQNDATLAQFSARILYDDNSSVLVNSIDEFTHYNEIRPIVSNGLDLSWRWLVKFRGSNIPEKQEIEISFRTNPAKPKSPLGSGLIARRAR